VSAQNEVEAVRWVTVHGFVNGVLLFVTLYWNASMQL
jgi:hypothetical protein